MPFVTSKIEIYNFMLNWQVESHLKFEGPSLSEKKIEGPKIQNICSIYWYYVRGDRENEYFESEINS